MAEPQRRLDAREIAALKAWGAEIAKSAAGLEGFAEGLTAENIGVFVASLSPEARAAILKKLQSGNKPTA